MFVRASPTCLLQFVLGFCGEIIHAVMDHSGLYFVGTLKSIYTGHKGIAVCCSEQVTNRDTWAPMCL
jgi:hypothetical protein